MAERKCTCYTLLAPNWNCPVHGRRRQVGTIGHVAPPALSAKFGGELKRYRWCAACCVAMAADDPTEAMEARLALRGTRGVPPAEGAKA